MDKAILVEKDISEGKKIVQNLDNSGLFFPLAMWFLKPDNNEWRLIFGASDIEEKGTREYYKKIQQSLNKMQPATDITVNDISVISTNNSLAKLIKSAIKTGKDISGIRFSGNVVNGVLINDAFIYRA